MNLKFKNTSSNNRRLTLLASVICISVIGQGCKEENLTVDSTKNVDTENVIPAQEVPIKKDKNVDIIANDISKKVSEVKESLEDIKAENYALNTANNESMKVNISQIYVVDGDTIYGIDEAGKKIKVRMTGIDAPESSQPMGAESTESLRDCVGYNENAILTVQLNNASDKYGRTLAKVESGEMDCNQQQIEKGMAWFYEDFSDKLASGDKALYSNAQDYAQQNQMGIWAMDLQKPWEYRKQNK